MGGPEVAAIVLSSESVEWPGVDVAGHLNSEVDEPDGDDEEQGVGAVVSHGVPLYLKL
jgi:hypothetical protein